MSLTTFNRKFPQQDTFVIFDEIDQMMGTSAFYLLKEGETGLRSLYRPSQMEKWKCIMGFSGTIAESTQQQFETEFENAVCITIPSLRETGYNNKVVSVVERSDDLTKDLKMTIPKTLTSSTNLILIFES